MIFIRFICKMNICEIALLLIMSTLYKYISINTKYTRCSDDAVAMNHFYAATLQDFPLTLWLVHFNPVVL